MGQGRSPKVLTPNEGSLPSWALSTGLLGVHGGPGRGPSALTPIISAALSVPAGGARMISPHFPGEETEASAENGPAEPRPDPRHLAECWPCYSGQLWGDSGLWPGWVRLVLPPPGQVHPRDEAGRIC